MMLSNICAITRLEIRFLSLYLKRENWQCDCGVALYEISSVGFSVRFTAALMVERRSSEETLFRDCCRARPRNAFTAIYYRMTFFYMSATFVVSADKSFCHRIEFFVSIFIVNDLLRLALSTFCLRQRISYGWVCFAKRCHCFVSANASEERKGNGIREFSKGITEKVFVVRKVLTVLALSF